MRVLGVWDGHDSGAALVEDGKVIFAANEERFTKRKLEVAFPNHAIHAALKYAGLKPTDIEEIAFTTTEFTKTLERVFPSMKENYYRFRRRKTPMPRFEGARHKLKYRMTSIGILPMCEAVSKHVVSKRLRALGFERFRLHTVEHHDAHAATAAFTSPFGKQLVITVDGLGDGLSGSISTLENGRLERRGTIKARDSLGVFFEQATNIVGMRELEDEGKVMAMADYSYPFKYDENKLKRFFSVEGTTLRARNSPAKQYDLLRSIAWQTPREQFAYMAQQVLENMLVRFSSNAIDRYNMEDVSFAGGVFSNIKANMRIRSLENVKHAYIFPHMGDGGIALGAALYASYALSGKTHFEFSPYAGEEFDTDATEAELSRDKHLSVQRESAHEQAAHAAELVSMDNYIFWFQGRMEYGPRALGDRSIVASSGSDTVKEKLNMYVKKREWFQPFAPSILESEVDRIFEYDGKGYDKFMTSAFFVKDGMRDIAKSVVHVDGSARPQMVGKENARYSELLSQVKKQQGHGMVLNTSFNVHGKPIVMDPHDAAETMKATKTKYMFINGLFVTNRNGV